MSTGGSPTPEERFAVISRKAVVILAYALVAAAFTAFIADQTALGVVLVVIAFVTLVARALWTLRRGLRVVAARKKAQVPAAPIATPDAPSAVDRVVGDLVGINGDELPYAITASRSPDGVDVEVRWKSEEVRWQSLFVKGSVAYAWRMDLTLDPSTAHYRFTEHSATASTRTTVGADGVSARGAWSWKKGKTALQQSLTISEGADGQVVVGGGDARRTSWDGVAHIQPADAKVPVFTVLRNHGWRPRHDWFGARLFER
ncbi:hypothetical protein FE697_016925 [Mumia zhuanghuii]|uniref:DUF4178 domain-containing protein n=2 Tax=Mumia TaxID=1546255 RepID=A0ABW1QPQ0_9ACTN|nr:MULTISPECIES: hypothetical protein [Mumia]KAA1420630.1 hypothetical protein FE697_016925 [Mumia zhuanghuii]